MLTKNLYMVNNLWFTVVVEGDTFIRVPRESWALAKAFAKSSKRKMREVVATALSQYIRRQEAKKK